MKYTQKSFTFVGSTSDTYAHAHAVCRDTGHMAPDVRGKCLRCAEPVQGHVRLDTDGSHEMTHRGRTPADVTTP